MTIKSAEQLAKVLAAHDTLFVRISNGPVADRKMGTSRNHQTGGRERGLSVNQSDYLTEYCFLLAGQPRAYPWLLTGREICRGSDNEPIVVDWQPVARIDRALFDALIEARYEQALDEGAQREGYLYPFGIFERNGRQYLKVRDRDLNGMEFGYIVTRMVAA